MDLVSRYAADESGATAVEYGLLAALIGVGAIVGFSAFGSNTDSAWNTLTEKFTNTIS